MFRIFILIDQKYVNDSLPSNNFLVKVSWSIKQIICFNQRRVKAVLDAFFKNLNARAEDIWNVRTNGFYCVYISGFYMLAIDSYTWLKIFRFRIRKHQSHSTFNAQLSWLKMIATLYTSFCLEPLRLLKIFVRHLSLIVSSTAFCLVQPSFWISLPSMR